MSEHAPLFIAVTRYRAAPEGADLARTGAIQRATVGAPGALGATVFRSTTDGGEMLRITWWESLEARDRLHASGAGQRLALGSGPAREFYALVHDGRSAARHERDPNAPLFVAITRYRAEAADDAAERTRGIQQAVAGAPGALGAQVFHSTTDPQAMLRITWWESLEARDHLHASEVGRHLGLGSGPPREFYRIVADSRRADIR
ncbi:MAG TPA: antibiotic biosynthesis monooxygenase family protein [Chloroflexota bacterium]